MRVFSGGCYYQRGRTLGLALYGDQAPALLAFNLDRDISTGDGKDSSLSSFAARLTSGDHA